MDAILAGTHAFFVKGQSGLEADIAIVENQNNHWFPYLATVAVGDATDNLAQLPPCAIATRHTSPTG